MTIAELRTMLQALGYGVDTESAQNSLLQLAYHNICIKRPWYWLRTVVTGSLVAGDTKVDILTALFSGATGPPRRWHSVALRDTLTTPQYIHPLDYLTPQKMIEKKGVGVTWPFSERGLPSYWSWYREGDANPMLHFWSPADQGYSVDVEHTRSANTLAGAVEPFMPEDHQPIIVYEAILMMALRQRDRSFIDFAQTQRDDLLRIMEAEDDTQQTGSPNIVVQDYNWDMHARRGGL